MSRTQTQPNSATDLKAADLRIKLASTFLDPGKDDASKSRLGAHSQVFKGQSAIQTQRAYFTIENNTRLATHRKLEQFVNNVVSNSINQFLIHI